MIVGYARVSTTEQDFDTQVGRLKEAGAEIVYSEKASAKSLKDRHELARAVGSLRPGDILLVTKLDRMARNVQDLLGLVQRMREAGAEFRCLDQPVQTDGPMGRLVLTMLGAFAEFERDMIAERQAEGIAAAKAKGVYDHSGWSQKLSWCSRRLNQGWTIAEVAAKYGVSADTLQRKFPQHKDRVAVAREAAKKSAGARTEAVLPAGVTISPVSDDDLAKLRRLGPGPIIPVDPIADARAELNAMQAQLDAIAAKPRRGILGFLRP